MKVNSLVVIGVILVVAVVIWTRGNKAQIQIEIPNEETRAEGTIFYHEDDFCQVQLTPFENLNELIKQAENSSDFAEKYFDGHGYTDIMVREEAKIRLRDKNIHPKELDSILVTVGTDKHTDVITGYGQDHRVESKNTIGYGEDYSAIYYDFIGNSVQNIWMTNVSSLNNDKVSQALFEIGTRWNLLLMDWNSHELVDLKDQDQIKKYLK